MYIRWASSTFCLSNPPTMLLSVQDYRQRSFAQCVSSETEPGTMLLASKLLTEQLRVYVSSG